VKGKGSVSGRGIRNALEEKNEQEKTTGKTSRENEQGKEITYFS